MKKDIVIWGAGLYGGRFLKSIGEENVSFFIDRNKDIKEFIGKKVINPDEISDDEWSRNFIYIPFNYYDEINEYLQTKGLKEKENYDIYYSVLRVPYSVADSDMKRYETDLDGLGNWEEKTVVIGRSWERKEYLYAFRQMLINGMDIAFISETVCMDSNESRKIIEAPICVAPVFSDEEAIIDVSDEDGMCITHDLPELLKDQEVHMEKVFPGYSKRSYLHTIEMLYRYYSVTIEKLKVKKILCISSITVGHEILRDICKEKGIDIIYISKGVIDGTLCIDVGGEVGRSLPAIYNKQIRNLPVNSLEISEAASICHKLYIDRASRKLQPKNDWYGGIKDRIMKDRPIVFFAGQNDVQSNMVPYTELTRNYNSPIFETTLDAAVFLANLCKQNDWNFIYKPHPMYSHPEQVYKLPNNAIFVEFGDVTEIIDFCDVTVTILSTTGYVSLLRNKPVVMLGYTQLKGSGSTYEAFEEQSIIENIRMAISEGYTKEQREAFHRHIAILLKYYLYDDMQPRNFRYGRPIPNSAGGFHYLDELILTMSG